MRYMFYGRLDDAIATLERAVQYLKNNVPNVPEVGNAPR